MKHYKILYLLFLSFFVLACSSGPIKHRKVKYAKVPDNYNTQYMGHYKIGKKYKIKGRTYYPKNYRFYSATGYASWYGRECGFHGNKTANGDIYNKNLLTAAHKTLPLPSLVRVTNLENRKSIILLVNDRGPFVKNREIDVSEKSAKLLGFRKNGVAKVKVTYLPSHTKSFLNKIGMEPKEGAKATHDLAKYNLTINKLLYDVNLRNKKK